MVKDRSSEISPIALGMCTILMSSIIQLVVYVDEGVNDLAMDWFLRFEEKKLIYCKIICFSVAG